MLEIQKQLSEWRNSRNIKTFPITIKDDLLKELEEVKEALRNLDFNNYVEELADIAIFAFNGLGLLNMSYSSKRTCVLTSLPMLELYINRLRLEFPMQTYTILCHIITMCEELVAANKYDFKKVVLEKIKVISSRLQDPVQKKLWAKNGATSKWEKMKDQPKDTLYVGNYGKCKV